MQSPVAVAALMHIAKRPTRDEGAQDFLEYGLIAAVIALIAFGSVTRAGKTIYDVFWQGIANNF